MRVSDRVRAPAAPDEPAVLPRLGLVGGLRWAWRQLTSMRVALFLLLLVAVAAVPGSIWPQRAVDPSRVSTYLQENPELGRWLDRLGMFNVYTSPWFSAIYLLLVISLIGCVIPRTRLHWHALTAPPPRAPARLERLHQHEVHERDADERAGGIDQVAFALAQVVEPVADVHAAPRRTCRRPSTS